MGEEKKTISVKGVERSLYENLKELSALTGRTLGELTNEAYRLLLSTLEGAKELSKAFVEGLRAPDVATISDLEELEVTGDELRKLGKKASFKNIKRLTLRDLTDEIVDELVYGIQSVDHLLVPKGITKLKLLAKCRGIKKLEFLEAS